MLQELWMSWSSECSTTAQKNSLFSLEERVSMIEEMTKDIPNVTVASFDGLLVEFMNKIDASIIVRGLRAVTDF